MFLSPFTHADISRAILMASIRTLFYLLFSLTFLFKITHQAATISVSPKTLTKLNRTVTIQWHNVPNPSPLDFIGIYSPPSSRDNEFIGYIYLNSSAGSASGSGSVSIPLTNTRSNYQFRIFRWSFSEINPKKHDHDQNPLPQTRHRLAVSEEIGFGSEKLGPDQVHLAFTDQIDEMRVMFVMGDKSVGWVRYGKEMEQLDAEVGTEVTRYEKEDMCDFPANSSIGWRDPGWIHDGVMTGLESGKKYYYQVGSDANGWTPIHTFVSRSTAANETIAFLFGDMGTYAPYSTYYRTQDESVSTVKWLLRDIRDLGDRPSFISHIGDISYARGFSWIWDEFFSQIEPLASKVPYHVCIGNHEYDWPSQPFKPSWAAGCYGKDGGGECGIPYSLRFRMPGNSSLPTGTKAPDTRNLYYSFDVGPVHFLYISTETDFLKGSEQYNFIKTDLESVDRDEAPFVVVQGHRPMYTTSNENRDTPMREKMMEHLEPLLVGSNVTLALWGHVHRYERFCPMREYGCVGRSSNFTRKDGAPVHAVIGMGGQDWQAVWEPRANHPDMPVYPQPERSMYRGGEFGYTRLFATRERMRLEYVGNHDGQVHDVLEIYSGLGGDVAGKSLDFDGGGAGGDGVSKFKVSRYVVGAGVLVVGVIVGYLLGFLTRCGKVGAPRNAWTAVKSEET